MRQRAIIDVVIEGNSQGPFKDDNAREGDDGFLARAFRSGVDVPRGTRSTDGTGGRTPKNRIFWVICEWHGAVSQCLQAAWGNDETLKSVKFVFKRRDKEGKEKPIGTKTLTNATVACVELVMGGVGEIHLPDVMTPVLLDDDAQDVAVIGLEAEKIDADIMGAKASYARKAPGA